MFAGLFSGLRGAGTGAVPSVTGAGSLANVQTANFEGATEFAPSSSLRPVERPAQGLDSSLRPVQRPADLDTSGSEDDVVCTTGNCPVCDLITDDMLGEFFTGATAEELSTLAEGLNYNITTGRIDNKLRLSHFLGQVLQEVGRDIAPRESLYYTSLSRLSQVFSHIRNNPQVGRDLLAVQGREARERAIANVVYQDENRSPRYRLGNTEPGDGWRFRGRGLKMLTGRENYTNFSAGHQAIWGGDVDFVANPDLVADPRYSVRSALWYWVDRQCYGIADGGMTRAVADRVTATINPGTDSHASRWAFAREVYNSDTFTNVCYNRTLDLSNRLAARPFNPNDALYREGGFDRYERQ